MISHGVRLISIATTIRWFGWGLVEAMIPIFWFTFADSYAETGFLSSIYSIVFFIALPFASVLADKISARTIILIGLCLYPAIGLGYFLAGATGLVAFIVIVRIINGAAFAFDSVGRGAYIRRHSAKAEISGTLGYFDTITNSWWLVAVLISTVLVSLFPVHWMFLAIIPTTLIAIYIISKVKETSHESLGVGIRESFREGVFVSMFKEIKEWNAGLRIFGFLSFLFGCIGPIASLFIPIAAYTEGANLQEVILLTLAIALPSAFGRPMGKFADRNSMGALLIGLALMAASIFAFALTDVYWQQLATAFGIGLAIEIAHLSVDGMATRMVSRRHYGRLSGAIEGLGNIGDLIGPIALGFMIDSLGQFKAFSFVTIIILFMFCLALLNRKKLEHSRKLHTMVAAPQVE